MSGGILVITVIIVFAIYIYMRHSFKKRKRAVEEIDTVRYYHEKVRAKKDLLNTLTRTTGTELMSLNITVMRIIGNVKDYKYISSFLHFM